MQQTQAPPVVWLRRRLRSVCSFSNAVWRRAANRVCTYFVYDLFNLEMSTTLAIYLTCLPALLALLTCQDPNTESCSHRGYPSTPWTPISFRSPAALTNIITSFCVIKNQPECHYSIRRPTGRRRDSGNRQASKAPPGKAPKAVSPASGSWDGRGDSGLICERSCLKVFPLKR